MNATKRTQKYGVGGGGWKIEGNGNPRPGTVMEEVLYVQHNKNGPRSIRLLAKSELSTTLKESKNQLFSLKKQRRRSVTTMDSHKSAMAILPSLDRVMAGRDVLKASQCTPELFSTMHHLPHNFSVTMDEILGIAPTDAGKELTSSRRKSSAMRRAIEEVEAVGGPTSEVRSVAWPRSHHEESEWARLIKKYKIIQRSRNKEAALSEAAESAFGDVTAKESMQKATSIEMTGLQLNVVPRQWTNVTMTKISLMACQVPALPTQFGQLVPNLQQLLLPHNRLTALPPTFSLLKKLVDLGLTANNFTEFPEVICDLTSLETLSLTNNRISILPAHISSCHNMRAIYLTRNPIVRIPLTIGLLSKLSIFTFDESPAVPNAPQVIHHLPEWALKASTGIKRDFYCMKLQNRIIRVKQILQANFLKATAAFQKMDADCSGDLDQEEMKNGLTFLKCETANFDELWAWLDKDHSGVIQYSEFMNSAMKDMFDPTYEADAILRQAVSEEEAFKEEEKNRHTERTRRMEKQTHGIVRAAFEKAKPVDVVARNLLAKIHRPSSLPGPGES